LAEKNEWLIIYARQLLAKEHFDYFIFGHRHYPVNYKLTDKSRYINLGDWIRNFTYASFDGNKIELKKWEA
jgi:UDP-2,3-diacylglucosamine hydrolase